MTFMSSAFTLLRDEAASPGFASRALMGAVMKACLTLVVRRLLDDLMEVHEQARGFSDKRLRRVVLHVAEYPGAAHTVASLADLAGMSRTTFATAFHDGFGVSPMAFVSRTRMHYASQLLTTTDMPIKRISAKHRLEPQPFLPHVQRRLRPIPAGLSRRRNRLSRPAPPPRRARQTLVERPDEGDPDRRRLHRLAPAVPSM